MKNIAPLTNEYGFKYYDHIPGGFRQAELKDYPAAFTSGRAFLIKRNGHEHYECHRARVPVKKKLLEFIREGKVYLHANQKQIL